MTGSSWLSTTVANTCLYQSCHVIKIYADSLYHISASSTLCCVCPLCLSVSEFHEQHRDTDFMVHSSASLKLFNLYPNGHRSCSKQKSCIVVFLVVEIHKPKLFNTFLFFSLHHPFHFYIGRFNHKSPTSFYSVLNVIMNNISNNALG